MAEIQGETPSGESPRPATTAPGGAHPTPEDSARRWQIDRTRTGLSLLFVGVVVFLVPFANVVGLFTALVGIIWAFLGRKAFGLAHSRNALIALALFVGGLAGLIAVFFLFISGIQVVAAFNAGFVLVGILFLSYPLLAHAVSSRRGQILLWGGYALTVGALAAGYVLFILPFGLSGIQWAVFHFVQALGGSPLFVFLSFAVFIGLLFLVPSVLYAVGFYVAYSRVKSGEIPA